MCLGGHGRGSKREDCQEPAEVGRVLLMEPQFAADWPLPFLESTSKIASKAAVVVQL